MRFQFTITGRTPLLMHANNIEAADKLDAWRKDPANKNASKAGDDRSPAWTWLAYLYHDGQQLTIPEDNLAVCLRQAGSRIVMKKQKTFKESAVSGLWMEQDHMPLICNEKPIPVKPLESLEKQTSYPSHLEAVRKMGFDLFAKRAKIGQSMHVRVRPRFEQWGITGAVEITAEEITAEVLEQIFNEAGKLGLGDWRPGCKTPGRFGMFETKLKRLD